MANRNLFLESADVLQELRESVGADVMEDIVQNYSVNHSCQSDAAFNVGQHDFEKKSWSCQSTEDSFEGNNRYAEFQIQNHLPQANSKIMEGNSPTNYLVEKQYGYVSRTAIEHLAGQGNAIEHLAGHRNGVEHLAGHRNGVERSAGHRNIVEHLALHGNVVECSAGHSNGVEHLAVHGNVVERSAGHRNGVEHLPGHGNIVELSAGQRNGVEQLAGHRNAVEHLTGHGNPIQHLARRSPNTREFYGVDSFPPPLALSRNIYETNHSTLPNFNMTQITVTQQQFNSLQPQCLFQTQPFYNQAVDSNQLSSTPTYVSQPFHVNQQVTCAPNPVTHRRILKPKRPSISVQGTNYNPTTVPLSLCDKLAMESTNFVPISQKPVMCSTPVNRQFENLPPICPSDKPSFPSPVTTLSPKNLSFNDSGFSSEISTPNSSCSQNKFSSIDASSKSDSLSPTILCRPKHPLESSRKRKAKESGVGQTKSKKIRHNEPLNDDAVLIMSKWYEDHRDSPYPTTTEKEEMAMKGNITISQVKSWFANKRNRSNNTRPKVQKQKLETKLINICKQLSVDAQRPAQTNSHIIHQLSALLNQAKA